MTNALRRRRHVPATPVICANCGRELDGTETPDGFRVRRHRDRLLEVYCPGTHRTDHQPVVVFRSDVLNNREVGL